jgi:AraC-like DNA-binding protein
MVKNLSFMVKIDISQIIALENKKHRCFFNNAPKAPVACNVISMTDLNKKVENHSLSYFTFTCVLRGSGRILLDENTYELKPGFTFLRFPDEKFNIYRSNDYIEFSIALPPEFGTMAKNYYSGEIRVFELELTSQMLSSFKYIFDLSRSNGSEKILDSAFEMFKFTTEICSGREYGEHLPEKSFARQSCELLRRSLNSVSPGIDAAQKMGIGYESFRKKFRQEMNISPKQYIMRLKFKKAAEMILNDYSIKETAFELGYSEIPAFSRQFKKNHSISPSEYRKRVKRLYES